MSSKILLIAASVVWLVIGQTVRGEVVLIDDFEQGVRGDIWKKWPEADETLKTDESANHTPAGMQSARAYEADPYGYAAYADFGATAGAVRAEVWIHDPLDDDGLDYDRPVSIMLALVGASDEPESWTDYLQFGVCAWYDDGFTSRYTVRTKYHDTSGLGYIRTQTYRKQGWTKLAIEADAHRDGGQARFYIDDQLVATSKRSCKVDLQYVRLGLNFKSYDNIWYDDVMVEVDPIPVCHTPRFDADGDSDVDQDDFGVFQRCFTGAANAFDCHMCRCMDGNVNERVDEADLVSFTACLSGPSVPAPAGCDSGLPLP